MDNCNSTIAWSRPEDSGNVNPLWAELQAGYLFVHFLEEEMVRSVIYTVHDMTGSSGTEKSRLVSSSYQEVYDWTLKMCPPSKDMCSLFKHFQRTTTAKDATSLPSSALALKTHEKKAPLYKWRKWCICTAALTSLIKADYLTQTPNWVSCAVFPRENKPWFNIRYILLNSFCYKWAEIYLHQKNMHLPHLLVLLLSAPPSMNLLNVVFVIMAFTFFATGTVILCKKQWLKTTTFHLLIN